MPLVLPVKTEKLEKPVRLDPVVNPDSQEQELVFTKVTKPAVIIKTSFVIYIVEEFQFKQLNFAYETYLKE